MERSPPRAPEPPPQGVFALFLQPDSSTTLGVKVDGSSGLELPPEPVYDPNAEIRRAQAARTAELEATRQAVQQRLDQYAVVIKRARFRFAVAVGPPILLPTPPLYLFHGGADMTALTPPPPPLHLLILPRILAL